MVVVPAEFPVASSEVIASAKAGDRAALAELWRIYQPQVLRFLRARGCAEADDVASDMWERIGHSLDRFEGHGRDFRRWAFTIARRLHVDWLRSAEARTAPVPPGNPALSAAPTDDPALAEVGSLDWALELMARLTPDMADAVMLRFVHDLPVDDVAAIMETSESNVRVLTHRGLTRLRELMDDDASSRRTAVTENVGPAVTR